MINKLFGYTGGFLLLAVAGFWAMHATVAGANAAGDLDVITGIVTSEKGPEAGVWVIAETDDLETPFKKIVVTNDEGRYLLPELPKANYKVWVRGYGLVDSKPVTASPGKRLNLEAVIAPTPQAAAAIYPANYWASLIEPPRANEFPGTGPEGNGIHPAMKSQAHWVNNIKSCQRCHQVGAAKTRTTSHLGQLGSSKEAWDIRVQLDKRMTGTMSDFGRERGLEVFADWTDRIADGEVPEAPPRPSGVERNVVITLWAWTSNVAFVHDEIATDKRNPQVNANGPIYGVWAAHGAPGALISLDPNTHESKHIPIVDDKGTEIGRFGHNPMFDETGRVWLTLATVPFRQPDWCTDPSLSKYAKYFPMNGPSYNNGTGYYDPASGKFELFETCQFTHHLQFDFDDDRTLYLSNPQGQVVQWVNTKLYDKTRDASKTVGWCPLVLDTNGDGRITKPWNEPRMPIMGGGDSVWQVPSVLTDPSHDTRILPGSYGIIVNPIDGSVWGASDVFPGEIFRLEVGKNPPETCITERFTIPVEKGFRPRGLDVDRNGVIWTALAGNSTYASFDRRKCKVFNGPEVLNGRQCDEGWTFYPTPGPTYKGTDFRTDYQYYNWVDQFNTLGLGENVPIVNGSASDSLQALDPETGEWVVMRVPYPQGFHSRGLDGRIDDPEAGWKGRGVYANYGGMGNWSLVEDGPTGGGGYLLKFQIRPDPLAR